MNTLEKAASRIGQLVTEKNLAYGDAFGKSDQILKILYPEGVRPDQYGDMLAVIRIIDKLFRVATRKDTFGESPWEDICGYGLLASVRDQD